MALPKKITAEELDRQTAIHQRQVNQYTNARPRQRFAYASHITKTERKIQYLLRNLPIEDVRAWYAKQGITVDSEVS